MTDEISKMLTLSTAHIKAATSSDMEVQVDGLPVFFAKDDYGWFVHVPTLEEMPPNCPDDLEGVLAYARGLGCGWLCLDRDGDVNPNLPTWEW